MSKINWISNENAAKMSIYYILFGFMTHKFQTLNDASTVIQNMLFPQCESTVNKYLYMYLY